MWQTEGNVIVSEMWIEISVTLAPTHSGKTTLSRAGIHSNGHKFDHAAMDQTEKRRG